jgi:hypothetical protein
MKNRPPSFLVFVLSVCTALAQPPVVVGDGQRAVIENEGGRAASLVAVPAMPEGGSQRIVVEVENVPPPPVAAPVVPKKVALVVQNHCVPLAGIPMEALTDALSAKLTRGALRIVNPHNVIGMTQNTTAAGEEIPAISAVDLAREVGADGIVTASVTEFLETTVGTPVDVYQFSARVTLNLADAGSGAGVCGTTVLAKSPKYTPNQVAANSPAYLGELLHSAVEACADKLLADPAIAAWEPDGLPSPPPPKAPPPQKPGGELTISDLDGILLKMLGDMRLDALFRSNYDAAQREMERLPIAVIGGIEDKTGEWRADLLEACGQTVRVALFRSGLFEVKDDGMMVTLAERIIGSGNSPLENPELMAALKQHGSPDFYVVGDLRLFAEGAYKAYRARLAVHSLHTGKIVWEGIETILK